MNNEPTMQAIAQEVTSSILSGPDGDHLHVTESGHTVGKFVLRID